MGSSNSERLSWLLVAWFLVFFMECMSEAHPWTRPRLGVRAKSSAARPRPMAEGDFVTYYYTQTLDHFSYRPESYTTFQQRYVVNSRYWGGANTSSPIFVYTGDEEGLIDDLDAAGLMVDFAPSFKALLVYIEHRYYGESLPFGSREEEYRNASTLGYFSSAQALADYAELIRNLKTNLSADDCPVIAIGGSYGGMLASWFRLKYPHIAIGALAISAPILYFDDITPENGYYTVVTKDYKEMSESCYNTIRQLWFEIDQNASQPNGLTALSNKFRTCSLLKNAQELKDYLEDMFVVSAQYDNPPKYPVSQICYAIDGASQESDVLDKIFAAVVATKGNCSCYSTNQSAFSSETLEGWRWQTCSEIVMPIGRSSNDTMFQGSPFNLTAFSDDCKRTFGVIPRPHWITTEFGGHDIKSVLKRFASNIIFSNGLRDPYSSGGVLQNISDSIVAIYTTQGAHCLDILPALPNDPDWLVSQRNMEKKIMEGWIADYNANFSRVAVNKPKNGI
ncbi:hypothetical protein MRB53_000909 [Persea americana]|uniref:Uncharacterized protein n=1 Tax=Persea americana TaxID=3435 RepID=A0ACC2MR36_PERAE|nr:hypothetical protein MRB53_000909 [Persea americana]